VAEKLDGLRVLVLEDEFLIAMDVEQICRDYGASDVIIARTIEEAEAALDSAAFDAAIFDLILNQQSTLGLAARLNEKAVPFIFASGYDGFGESSNPFPDVKLVGKPYSDVEIVGALAAACGRR
jgi:DNA-binding NtrC family response regulator